MELNKNQFLFISILLYYILMYLSSKIAFYNNILLVGVLLTLFIIPVIVYKNYNKYE